MDPFSRLAPQPQRMQAASPSFPLPSVQAIYLVGPAEPLYTPALRLQAALNGQGLNVPLNAAPAPGPAFRLAIDPAQVGRAQGYKLLVDEEGAQVVGHDPAGLFYGVCTLCQWITLHTTTLHTGESALSGVQIVDWPDYPNRGIMLDVTRDRVPTMPTLYMLVDLLASLKINQLQLYMEHTFAYRGHDVVWQEASPFTGEEILALDAYCRERFIELVPNQNSFGHMHRWVKHPAYTHLAESPEGIEHSFSTHKEPYSLCPVDPGSIDLLADLYSQLLPHFSSRQFNVGLDETFDLGLGRSKAACEEKGTGQVYLDFLRQIHELTARHGVTMQFWSDIIVRDEPELAAHLPRDVVALEWGYDADYPFAEHAALIANSGRSFYVCPGTSSWNSLAGRTDNAVSNISSAARNGAEHGAMGLLTTDWGDNGHPQPLPVSFLGYLLGAAFAWNTHSAHVPAQLDIPGWLDAHLFQDRAGVMGRLAYDMGNVYQEPEAAVRNSSILFWLLILPDALPPRRQGNGSLTQAGLEKTLAYIDQVMAPLEQAEMQRADAALIRDEYRWVADMLRLGCRMGMARLQIGLDRPVDELAPEVRRGLAELLAPLIERHRTLWLQRSRPGGLPDALSRFQNTLAHLNGEV